MHTIVLVLACLGCESHGRRVKATSEQVQYSSNEEHLLSQFLPVRLHVPNRNPSVLERMKRYDDIDDTPFDYLVNAEQTMPHSELFSQQLPQVDISDMASVYDQLRASTSNGFFDLQDVDARDAHVDGLSSPADEVADPRPIGVSASSVINMWTQRAELLASFSEYNMSDIDRAQMQKFRNKLPQIFYILRRMAVELESNPPAQILALVTKGIGLEAHLPSHVVAMAVTAKRSQLDHTGQLDDIAKRQGLKEAGAGLYKDGRVPVVKIETVVATPMPGVQSGLGKELILQIVRHAAASGHLVVLTPANGGLRKYYQNMGFERIDGEVDMDTGRSTLKMVYGEPVHRVTGHALSFELCSLKVA